MKKMLKLIMSMMLMISSFTIGVFSEESETEGADSVNVIIRKADASLDASLIGELPFTEGLVVEANAPIFVPENSSQDVERIELQFVDEQGNMSSFVMPDRRYESTDSKILLRKENYAYINPILAGKYTVTVLVHMVDASSPPPKPFINSYQVADLFEFEGTHKNVPSTSYVNVEQQGVRVGCDLSESGCKEWLEALHYNNLNTSYLMISASGSSLTIPKQDSEDPAYKSSEVFPYQEGDSEILVPASIVTSVPIELGKNYEFSVHADGYFSISKEAAAPFGSAPLDSSKIKIEQVEVGTDGEPALVISVPNSSEYRQWIYLINTLEFPDHGLVGIEDNAYIETEEKISYELPYHLSGGFGKTDENGITLGVMAPGYSTMYVDNVVIHYAYEPAPINSFSVAVKGKGLEISAVGPGGRAWLEALTVFKENLTYRPYIRMYANNMGNVTMIRLSNANENDYVLSKDNLTPKSMEGTDENTVHTLFIPVEAVLKSGTMGAGNTVVNVMPNPYGYSQNPMLSNVSLYPMMRLVSETQDAAKNDKEIDTEVLDELDGYLTGKQITNVTVMVNNDDLRKNGSPNVELKGELTAMIVSDEDGNYTVNDLNQDSVSMNMSTTIDEVKLTEAQIEEYVETLMATANEMQTVYDNFGFDVKLHKEDKEMKDLAVATAITFELPEAITVNDGDTLVLLTVHNGTAKYLPVVVMTDENGNRTGIAYTSEFSSFVPVVISQSSLTDSKQVPSDAKATYNSSTGLSITSADKTWIQGTQGFNMTSVIESENEDSIIFTGQSYEINEDGLLLDLDFLKGQHQLTNGKYTIKVESENYYIGTFEFEINETVPEAVLSYKDNTFGITTENADYVNALKQAGKVLCLNEYTFNMISSSINSVTSDGNKYTFALSESLEQGQYECTVYVPGYQIITTKANVIDSAQEKAVKMEVTEDGSIKLIPNTIDYDSLFAGLITNQGSQRGRLTFVSVTDTSNTFTHSRPGNAGSPTGMPFYKTDNEAKTIMITVDQIRKYAPGEYNVTYYVGDKYYSLGTITLTHEQLFDMPAYTYSYDLKKEVLTIESDDLDFLKKIEFINFVRGSYIYSIDEITVKENKKTITIPREDLGALVSVRGNGTEGGEKFYSGTYKISIQVEGYAGDSGTTSNWVNIYPAVVKNEKPVKDNKHGVHGRDHICDYLHGHMQTYVEEVFDETYTNDGSCSSAADNAVKGALVSSEISAEAVITDEVNTNNSQLITTEMSDHEVASVFEMDVVVTVDGEIQNGATLNELDEALEYEMDIPTDLPEVKDGYKREYSIVRVHDGKVEKLETEPTTSNTLEFESDLYSTYALVYKDVKVDPETKVEAEKLTTVPEELVSKYETAEKLEEKMVTVLSEKSSVSKENTAVYDVVLMVTFDGVNYVEADETHWPADGKIHVVLPYPTGTDKSFEFTVAHMFTKNLFGKKAGDIEYPAVTLTEKGIEFDVTGLSPISLGWKKELTPIATPTPDVPNTSDDSNLLGWSFAAILSLCLMFIATLGKKKQHRKIKH